MIYSFPADYRTSEEVEINDAFSNVLLDIFQDHGFRSSLFAVQAHGAAGFALIRDRSTIESAKFLTLNTLAAAMRPILLDSEIVLGQASLAQPVVLGQASLAPPDKDKP